MSYFRSTDATISGRTFADRFLDDPAERNRYLAHLREAGIPARAVQKDPRFIADKLKQRRLTFSSRVSLIAPTDGFADNIQIVEEGVNSTTVRISGQLVDEQ